MRAYLVQFCTLTAVLAWGGCAPEDGTPTGTGGSPAATGGTGPVATGGMSGGTASGGKASGGMASGGKATGGATPACDPNTAQVGYTCTSGWGATMTPYILNNNWWGTDGATGKQCLWGTCQNGDTIGWVTNWNWSGGSNWVLTYTSVVFGWQYGFPVANTGLPIQVSSGKAINCGWDYALTQTSGSFNVAYDIWLHDTANPPSSGGQAGEIMIWLYNQGAAPAGSVTASSI